MKTQLAQPHPSQRTTQTVRASSRKKHGPAAARKANGDQFKADFRAWRSTLPAGMERETFLMPWAIAESVCAEVSRFFDLELPARYTGWLEAKALHCYDGNPHFHKLMHRGGNRSIDLLYAFMRHWLTSFLHLERPDLFRCLPVDFGNGLRLPDGLHPHLNRMGGGPGFIPRPLPWDASRVTRHERWAWLKGVVIPDGPAFSHPHG